MKTELIGWASSLVILLTIAKQIYMYTPHVVAVMTGQPLEIRNSDATLHNVMASPRENAPFQLRDAR